IVRWRYDADGNTLEESYFGVDGRPSADRLRGVASVRWEYGPHGKTVEESYSGPDGRRTEDKNRGVAMVRWQYDGSWNTVERRYFGTALNSKADRRQGAAIIRWQYDQYGRETGTSKFDRNEQPVRSRNYPRGAGRQRRRRAVIRTTADIEGIPTSGGSPHLLPV